MYTPIVLRCLLVARKKNLTGVSSGLTGRSTRPVFISDVDIFSTNLKKCSTADEERDDSYAQFTTHTI